MRLYDISLSAVFDSGCSLTAFDPKAEAAPAEEILAYINECSRVVEVTYNQNTDIIILTLGCGDKIVGTVVNAGGGG